MKKTRNQILIFSISLALFGVIYSHLYSFEASEAKIPPVIVGKSPKEANTFTQSDEFFRALFSKALRNIHINCQESALVNYQSQKLMSPDRKKSIFFELTLQRPANATRRQNQCISAGRQTVIRSMIVENAGKTLKLNTASLGYVRLIKTHYFVINPISFSPDSRFLVSRLDLFATSTDYYRLYAIFDFENKYRYLKLAPCKDDQFGGLYHTFTSNTEIVFKCDFSPNSYLEIINLQTLSIRRAPISSLKLPSHPVSFGSISKEFAVKP
jgi:WD40 repeat protein